MKVGILTEFPSPAVQSGPAIHTRFLSDGLMRRGHECTLIGPDTSDSEPMESGQHYLFKAWPYPTHPEVKLAVPGRPIDMFKNPPKVDVMHSQASSHMLHYGIWMRKMWRIPLLNTHVIHMPTHCHFLLSDGLYEKEWVMDWWRKRADSMERSFAKMYNEADSLIVQSRHLVSYWRDRGVTVPIDVVGRPINPGIFSASATHDPYPKGFKAGKRLLVVCRHDREKNLNYLLKLFATQIAPADSEVTLTLVGDGHDHRNLVEYAETLPHFDRVHFPGEQDHKQLLNWYTHANVFAYPSLSETFGNVVNEALWSGLPVVALNDNMGVAGQVVDGVNGFLIDTDTSVTDTQFAAACITLLRQRELRRKFGEEAATMSRRTSHPDIVLSRFEKIYEQAQRHCNQKIPVALSERSRLTQVSEYSKAIAQWGFWTSVLYGIATAATTMGTSRFGKAEQEQVRPVAPAVEPQDVLIPQSRSKRIS